MISSMALGKGLQSLIPQQKTRGVKDTDTTHQDTDRIWHIPLADIVPNTEQPRKQFSHQELEDLVQSIKVYGIMQPITVTENSQGGYELIAGERRFRASQIAGLPTIPAIVRTASTKEKLELAIIENVQRQNLNAIEEGFAYKRLVEEFAMTQEDVARQVGKNRSTVANMIRLLDLPTSIQEALINGHMSAGKARALLSLKNSAEQLDAFHSMMGKGMSVRDVEAAVGAKPASSRKGSVRRDPNVLSQERILEERFGTKVHITKKGDTGTIVFSFSSTEELRDLLEALR